MLTFAQFHRNLVEKLLKGFEDDGYVEIFQNPTAIELTEVGHKQDANWGLEKFGNKCYYIGGILTSKDLFVFNRQNSEHHKVSHQIPKLEREWVPLYLYYFAGENVIALSLSSFSMSPKMSLSFRDGSSKAILQHVAKHKAFRKFDLVFEDGNPIT